MVYRGKVIFDWPMIGNQNVTGYLQSTLKGDALSHAYLFSGPPQVGKKLATRYFITSLLCLEYHREGRHADSHQSFNAPCNRCLYCQLFKKNIYPDVYRVKKEEGKQDITVKQIQTLQHQLHLSGFYPTYKVGVIEGAENLNQEAANSLLKILEEPTDKTIIILITANPHVIPETLISRCQHLQFHLVPQREIYRYLIQQKQNRQQALVLSHLANGRPGRALAYANNPAAYQECSNVVLNFIEIMNGTVNKRFKIVYDLLLTTKDFLEASQRTQEILKIWSSVLRDMLLIKNHLQDRLIHFSFRSHFEKLAPRCSFHKLEVALQELEEIKTGLSQNSNPKLLLENFIINL